MTALDRAFIRAFKQETPAAKPAARAATPVRAPHAPFAAASTGKETDSLDDAPTILPLSAYTNVQHDEPPFRPAFEVDRFLWSPRCQEVVAAAAAGLDALARQLLAEA